MSLDKRILADFQGECAQLLKELAAVVSDIEDSHDVFPTEQIKEFSQKIDRIMGAAKTLLIYDPENPGIQFLASLAEMCKNMGYQAAALERVLLVPFFAGFWAETVEAMESVVTALNSVQATGEIVKKQSEVLQKRLAWLAEKVAPQGEEEKAKVVALLKKL
jgi:hypothetical protein